MWQATEIHCFKLHPELLFTNADKKKKKKREKNYWLPENIFYNIIIGNSC